MAAPSRARLPFHLISSAVVVAVAASCDRVYLAQVWGTVAPQVWWTIPLNIGFALIALGARAATGPAAFAGGTIAWLLLAAFGWGAWVVLGVGLVLTVLSTHIDLARKSAAGIAEARRGQRGAANIIANTGVAGAAAVVALSAGEPNLAAIVATASLATSIGDTVATELGQASRGVPRLITSWRRVPPGTPGAVSARGVMAGAIAALVLAAVAGVTGLITPLAIVPIAACSLVASLLEGVIAITAETRGWIDNDGVNLISSLAGAGLSVTACATLGAI